MPLKRSSIDNLSERERIVVDLLARGYTLRKISHMTGLCERSVYNYRKRSHVQKAVFARQQEMLGAASGQAIGLSEDCVQTLETIMKDPLARASDRIAASKALMNGAQAYTERKILERQLSDLEEQLRQTLQISPIPVDDFSGEVETNTESEDISTLLMLSASPEDGEDE